MLTMWLQLLVVVACGLTGLAGIVLLAFGVTLMATPKTDSRERMAALTLTLAGALAVAVPLSILKACIL